jgi:Helix-turn-helix domain
MEERAAAIEAAIMAQVQKGRVAFDIADLEPMGIGGKSKAYDLINEGKLRAVKVGRSTKILAVDFLAFLRSLPPIPPKPPDHQPDLRAQERGRLRHVRAPEGKCHGQQVGHRPRHRE